jgi:hypothetical protein
VRCCSEAAVNERSPLEERGSLSALPGAELLDSCWRRLSIRSSSSPRLGAEPLGGEFFEEVMVCGSFDSFEHSKLYVLSLAKRG